MSDPVVEIEQGKLKGKLCKTSKNREFYTFKGIPYAKPPVGELRFCAPRPPTPWDGVREFMNDTKVGPQYDLDFDYYAGEEDCLYLNVFTPNLPSTSSVLKPVMFYIHGGGFVFGYGIDETINGPDFLVEKDVVFVSINYRLGILGFLSLDCKEAPGNMGLKDQVEALKWVQKNIIKFGGDPNNVTIFGTSAGAASVEYLLLSPMAKGLFHKAISQAGSSLCHWAQNNKLKELAATIPVLNGGGVMNDDQLLKYLKSLPIKDLIVSSMKARAADTFVGGIHFGFVPVIEKPGDWQPFLDKSTYDILLSGEFTKVPFITGFCTREGLIMIPMGKSILENLAKENNFTKHLPFDIEETQKAKLEMKIKDIYFNAQNKYKDDDYFAIDFFTDVIILGGAYTAATLIAKESSPVFLYEFSYDGSLNAVKKMMNVKRKGACHADDVGYFLKNVMLTKATDTDILVRDRLVKMWTNFAKYGDPTPETDDLIPIKWTPFGNENGPACLVVDDKLTMKKGVYPKRTKLFQELYQKYYTP